MTATTEKRAGVALQKNRRRLAEAVVDRMYTRHPELWQSYGQDGREMSLRDADYHISYLIEALQWNDPLLFAQYFEWLKDLFVNLRFPDSVLPTMLDTYQEVIGKFLPAPIPALVDVYVESARKQIQKTGSEAPPYLDEKGPLYPLAKKYLDALLKGEREIAGRMILDAVEKGEDVKNIYLHVFQRTQHEIGRLWYLNRISVAEEHFASAATQLIMSQLYPYIFSTEKIGLKLVAACVADELHEIGIRMVADFFEMDGWDTYYIGANAPLAGIRDAIMKYRADILALSVTMPFHLTRLSETIKAIRSAVDMKGLKIMIGGYAANSFPDLWQRVGADGYARDAEQALHMAQKLMAYSETTGK